VHLSRTPEYRKAYAATHYRANKSDYLARNKRYKQHLRKIFNDLKSKPCVDCGQTFPPFVMDFDHRDQNSKSGEVSRMVLKSQLKDALKEVEKCDVVCANCHRVRTHRQYTKEQKRAKDLDR
jgi:hypothetical protein